MSGTEQGYCFKCKKQQEMKDTELKTTSNGRKMIGATNPSNSE
jgi:hypothetical protein